MTSPAHQDGTEPGESWIHRLPLDVRTDIARLGARGLAWRQPIPVTRSKLFLTTTELFWISEDSGDNKDSEDTVHYRCETRALPIEYRLVASRTREQHEALQTWLTLCNNSRTAALRTETFLLSVFRLPNIIIESTPEEYKNVRSDAVRPPPPPPLPLFEGGARDLVLNYITYKLDAFHLFSALRAVFGANLRRIHVLENDEWSYGLAGKALIASTQTNRVYFFHKAFSHPEAGMGQILRTAFRELNEPGAGETKLGVEVKEGDFDDQDAKVFELPSPCGAQRGAGGESLEDTLCYGEIIRHYGNGETRINKGVKGGLKRRFNGWPSVETKCFFLQVVRLAERFFPKLEYVSFCGPISNPTLEAQYEEDMAPMFLEPVYGGRHWG